MKESPPSRSTVTLVIGLFVSISICFIAAGIGGWVTGSSVDGWFASVNKPTWNPPNWVFGPVWSTLYLMMAISAWLVWKDSSLKNSRTALGWFAVQLVLNVLWSVLFFGLQQPGWAVVEIAGLWVSILVTILLFAKSSRLAAGLMTPYLLWVSFASYLNYTIWLLNRSA